MSDGYKAWDAPDAPSPAAASSAPPGYSPYTPEAAPERDWLDLAGAGAKGVGVGAGAGAAAYALRGILKRAFPGSMPKTTSLKRLHDAIRVGDSSSGLKQMFQQYMREVSTTGKPITFADFMAQQQGHAAANSVIKEMVQGSGNIPRIEEKLSDRVSGAKARILDDISNALGVPKESVVMGKDRLIADRKAKAGPLYDQAYKDDQPIRDSRFFRLFEAPAARKALAEAVRNGDNELKPIDIRSAANPRRKDWWKFANQREIPEGLFLDDDESAGLRKYIAPNMANADKIQQSLYAQMKAAMEKDAVTGYDKHTPASRALDSLHKQFMQTMYDVAPNDAYRQARQIYSGDSKLLEAHKVGSELLKMKPAEVRKAIAGMTPDQREALSSGFYGSLEDMNYQKLLREFVARPERYPERREVLSTVFRDPAKLDQFMANLRGEEAFSDSAAAFGNSPASKEPGPRAPWLRISENPLDQSSSTARVVAQLAPHLGWPSTRASRAGTDMLFRDPTFNPRSVSHPDWSRVIKEPLSAFDRLKGAGKVTGIGAGAGGVGGLGLYGLNQLPEDMGFDQ